MNMKFGKYQEISENNLRNFCQKLDSAEYKP